MSNTFDPSEQLALTRATERIYSSIGSLIPGAGTDFANYLFSISGSTISSGLIADAITNGAKGDGVNDDTNAINTALSKYPVVSLPPGTYKVTAPIILNAGQALVGTSGAVCNLLVAHSGQVVQMNGAGARLAHINMAPNVANTGLYTGVYLNQATNAIVDDVQVSSPSMGIVLYGAANNNVMTAVGVTAFNNQGLSFQTNGSVYPNNNNIVFRQLSGTSATPGKDTYGINLAGGDVNWIVGGEVSLCRWPITVGGNTNHLESVYVDQVEKHLVVTGGVHYLDCHWAANGTPSIAAGAKVLGNSGLDITRFQPFFQQKLSWYALKNLYLFNEGTGSLLHDLSGNGNHLTAIGTPSWDTDSVWGAGLHFDRGVPQYAAVTSSIDYTQTFTVAALIRPTAQIGTEPIVMEWLGGASYVRIERPGTQVQVRNYDGTTLTTVNGNGSTHTFSGEWTWVILSFNKTAGTVSVLDPYNGAEQVLNVPLTVFGSQTGVTLMGNNAGTAGIRGNIAYLGLWQRKLSMSECFDLVNNKLPPVPSYAADILSVVSVTGTSPRTLENRFADWLNVKDFGAVGDGVTDDTNAIVAANNKLSAAPLKILYFPAGTYAVQHDRLFLNQSNTRWLGDGPDSSVIKANAAGGQLFQSTAECSNVQFQDLAFDTSAGSISAFAVYGSATQRFTWYNCKFFGFENGTVALSFDRASQMEIERCEFRTQGRGKGNAISVNQGSSGLRIRNSKFRYCGGSIIVGTGTTTPDTGVAEDIEIQHSYFDQGWYYLKSYYNGSGGTVTYTVTTLTDTSKNFTGLTANDVVRVMPTRSTGTVTSTTGQSLTDNSATFTTTGLMRGEIIRTGNTFGIVSGIESDTVVHVEEWLDQTTYLPVAAPSAGATYTTYRVIIGTLLNATATVLTVDSWRDLTGAMLTPTAGWMYELAYHPIYNIHMEAGSRRIKVQNNTVRRGWGDQISLYGDDNLVTDNTVMDGFDMGITINGNSGRGHSLIANNKIYHQGSGAIWVTGENCLVSNNLCVAITWMNNVNVVYLAGVIAAGNNIHVIGNSVDGQNQPQSRWGVAAAGGDSIVISNNKGINFTSGGATISSYLATNLILRDNYPSTSIVHYTGTNAWDYGIMNGTTLPNSNVSGGPASMYRMAASTSTGPGRAFIKITGQSNTGWSEIVSTSTLGWVSVKEYGAVGDGVTDDTTACNNACAGLNGTSGGTVFFPVGTYLLTGNGILTNHPNITFKGVDYKLTTIKANQSSMSVFLYQSNIGGGNLRFEDLTVDSNLLALNGINIDGGNNLSISMTRVKIVNFDSNAGIATTGATRLTIRDCQFKSAGTGKGRAISLTTGSLNVDVSDSKFYYCNFGLSISNGSDTSINEQPANFIRFYNNYFDGGWQYLKSNASGPVGTVTYTGGGSPGLVDTGANFTGIVNSGDTVRVMATKNTGTSTSIDDHVLTDTTANFSTVLKGDLVRLSNSSFGIVDTIESNTVLHVEEWLDQTTYEPVVNNTNVSYTVYGVVLGIVNGAPTATGINVLRWFGYDGTIVTTPSTGTKYEVCYGNFGSGTAISTQSGTHQLSIFSNILRRSPGDCILMKGQHIQVLNNQFDSSKFASVHVINPTAGGNSYSNVSNNTIVHAGTQAVYFNGVNDGKIMNNVITGAWWATDNRFGIGGSIHINAGSNRIDVSDNLIDNFSQQNSLYGITVDGATASDSIRLYRNTVRNPTTTGIIFSGANITNHVLRDNNATVNHISSAPGGDYVLVGTGAPEGVVTAGPSSLFRRTDTGQMYIKESGTGNTNWAPYARSYERFNVKTYGAKGDGSTDDTTSIQSAIAAANTAGGGIVEFPKGTYIISTDLTMILYNNIRIKGSGIDSTTIKVKSGVTSRGFLVEHCASWSIEDLTIDPNKAGTTDFGSDSQQQGIYVATVGSVGNLRGLIRNVRVKTGWRHAINILNSATISGVKAFTWGTIAAGGSASTTVTVTGANIDDYATASMDIGLGGLLLSAEVTAANTVTVTAYNQTGSGITLGAGNLTATVSPLSYPNQTYLDNVFIESPARCGVICSYSKDIHLNRVIVDSPTAEGIYFYGCSQYHVIGSTVRNGTYHGIQAGTQCRDFQIIGNTSELNDPTNAGSGIGIVVSENSRRFIVANNVSRGNGNIGISIDVRRQAPNQNFCVPTDGVVTGNQCSYTTVNHGIYAQYFEGMSITGNVCNNNTNSGIFIVGGRNASVSGNTCHNNGQNGIGFNEPAGGTLVGGSGYHSIGENAFFGNGATDYTFGYGTSTAITKPVKVRLSNSGTYDWPSLATGSSQTTTLTVTGAMIGDVAQATMSTSLLGTTLKAEVTAQDTVTVTQSNATGGTVDLPSATLLVNVQKAY